MKIKKITCIVLDGELPDYTLRLVVPDYGMPLIGTILSEIGYDVKVYVEHIKPPEWNRIAESDLVCFSAWNAGADKTYRLAEKIRSQLNIPTIVGGVHASYFPESCLRYFDYVVFGEGDETIVELIATLEKGGELEQVPGIAFRNGNQILRTAPRAGPTTFDTIPDYSLIEGYRRMSFIDVLVRRKKPVLTVQSSRGCPFNCRFCIVNTMFPGGYRTRDIESVISDLRDKRRYSRDLIFVDNEFTADRAHAKKLLKRIIEENFGFDIVAFARTDVAKDDEILSLMRQAGINHLYQGYESLHPDTLIMYNKQQTLEQIKASIEKIHSFGFSIWGSFVVGADTDTRETSKYTIDFVIDQKLSNAYFWPIWGHYPEPRNGYQTIVPWYRSIFRGWRYSDGHFVTHFPLHMPPSILQKDIIDANRKINSPIQIIRAMKDRRFVDVKMKTLFRYQWRFVEKGVREYVGFLEELEDGLYDSDGHLREDLLVKRVNQDPGWTLRAGNQTRESVGLAPIELPVPGERNITCIPATLDSSDGP